MVILVRSCLIVYPMKYYSGPVDRVAHYLWMDLILSISYGLYPIDRMKSTYMMKNSVPSLFTMYNRKVEVLHGLNPTLRVIVLMYSLKKDMLPIGGRRYT